MRGIVRFYGATENKREVEMDMREMVDKVKKGEPLYGKSTMSPYMQGVASRNSRYNGVWLHVIPWFNFVNHDQVRNVTARSPEGVLTAASTELIRLSITDRLSGSLLRKVRGDHDGS